MRRGPPPAILAVAAALLLAAAASVRAEEVYLAPEAFLEQTFAGEVPAPRKLWITKALKSDVRAILGHDLAGLRMRYWAHGGLSAWILEEIGKVRPITTGFVVDGGAIARVAVLIYRESRGWEVRHAFFIDQFRGARLDDDLELDRTIDGISGATLSVRALTRLARLALYLHGKAFEGAR